MRRIVEQRVARPPMAIFLSLLRPNWWLDRLCGGGALLFVGHISGGQRLCV